MKNKINKIFYHKGFKKYFFNISWLLLEKILRLGVGLFVGIWIARYLGPYKYGLLSYAQSLVGLFSTVATLGVDSIVVRELVKYPNKEKELLSTGFILKLLGAILSFIILYITVHFLSNDCYTNILIFIIAGAVVFQSFNVIDLYFQAIVKSKYVVFANSFSLFCSSLIKIILILLKAPLIAFAWVVLFDSIILAAGYLYVFYIQKREIFLKKIKFNISIAKNLLKDSWPLMIGGISFMIFSNIDNVMIKEMLGAKEVGYYTAGYKLVTLWYFFPGLILGSLLPAIVKSRKTIRLFNYRILLLSTFMVWFAIFIAVIYFLFANLIIDMTFGKNFYKSVKILKYLSIVNVLIFYNSVWNHWMMIENKTKRILIFHFLTAIFNILFNLVLIKLFGVIGAVYALLLSLIVTYFVLSIYDKKIVIVFINALFLKILWSNNEKPD